MREMVAAREEYGRIVDLLRVQTGLARKPPPAEEYVFEPG
jgi:hypothetical protein